MRRSIFAIFAVIISMLGLAALGCEYRTSEQGPAGKKVLASKEPGPPAFVGLSPSRGAIRVFDGSGRLLREVKLQGDGWFRAMPSAKGLPVFGRRGSAGTTFATFDVKTGRVTKLEGEDSGNKAGPVRGTKCAGKVYEPYTGFPFDSPFMTVRSADGKKIGRIKVPSEKNDANKFHLEVGYPLCLDNKYLIVRALESLKPNNLVDRQETLYRMDLETNKFEVISPTRPTDEQAGFSKLAPSSRVNYFYGFEEMKTGHGAPYIDHVVAFKGLRELWRTEVPHLGLRNMTFGKEHDGRIVISSIRQRPRHGLGIVGAPRRPLDAADKISTVFSFDIDTGRIIEKIELPFVEDSSSQFFTSAFGELYFVNGEDAVARVTVVNPGASEPKKTIRMSHPATQLQPVY